MRAAITFDADAVEEEDDDDKKSDLVDLKIHDEDKMAVKLDSSPAEKTEKEEEKTEEKSESSEKKED